MEPDVGEMDSLSLSVFLTHRTKVQASCKDEDTVFTTQKMTSEISQHANSRSTTFSEGLVESRKPTAVTVSDMVSDEGRTWSKTGQ